MDLLLIVRDGLECGEDGVAAVGGSARAAMEQLGEERVVDRGGEGEVIGGLVISGRA